MSDRYEMRLHDLDEVDEPEGARASRRTGNGPSGLDHGVVTETIEARLGRVSVAARGVLTSVDLHEYALRAMRPDRVADYLVAAVNRAQSHQAAARQGEQS